MPAFQHLTPEELAVMTPSEQLAYIAGLQDEARALRAQLSATVTFRRGSFNGKPMLEVSGLGTKPLNHGLKVWSNIAEHAEAIREACTAEGFAKLAERDAK